MRNAIVLVAMAVMFSGLACNKVQGQEQTAPPQHGAKRDTGNGIEPAAANDTDHVVTYEDDFAKSYSENTKSDWIEKVPALPEFEGWYRHLGSGEYWQDVFSFAGYVGVRSMNSLRVFEPASGKYVWEGRTGYLVDDAKIVGGDGWVCYGEHDTVAVNMNSGKILWKKEHLGPFAATNSSKEASVWLAKREYQRALGTVYEVVELQHIQSQEVLQRFPDLTLLKVCGQSNGNSEILVGRTQTGFKVFCVDGSSSEFDAQSYGGEIEMMLFGDVLVSLEEVPYNWNSNREVLEKWENRQKSKPKAILTAFSLDGTVLWQLEIFRDFYFGDRSIMAFNDTLVTIQLSPGLMVCSMVDGEVLYKSPPNSNGGMITEPMENFVCWDGYQSYGMYSSLFLFDPATKKGINMLGDGPLQIKKILPLDGQLFVMAETNPNGYGISGINYHLMALNLGADILPLPGEMTKLGMPEDQSGLADRFQKSEDPLADEALLEEIREGGINAFSPLLNDLANNDSAYLDALGRLAVTMERSGDDPDGGSNSSSSGYPKALPPTSALMQKLAGDPREKYSDCIIDWLNDPSMEILHYRLLGVLALCGGSDAGEYLSSHYGNRALKEREIPAPPFKIAKRPYGSWAEVVLDSGERIAAFVNGGLRDDRDIYFGIDTDNDGLYEEMLSTGIEDCFYTGGFREVPENLKLTADGDILHLKYNVPIFGEEVRDWDGEAKTYKVVVDSEFAEANMTLAEVRLDSDGDGLTDITEGLLLTNPNDPDTDGDGIPDEHDPCPNLDPDSVGKLERGAIRAFDYYYYPPGQNPSVQNNDEFQIWEASYFVMNDGASLAYSEGGAAFGIALINPVDEMDSTYLEKQFRGARVFQVSLGGTNEMGYSITFSDSPSCYAEMLLVEIDGEIYPSQILRRACTH